MPSRAKKPTQTRRKTQPRKQQPRKSEPRKSEPRKRTRKKREKARVEQPATTSDQRVSKLGNKHACWSCGAKFYDLNKPEPICPKCEADQRKRPAQAEPPRAAPPPAPVRKPPPRPMASLLDDEEEESAPAYEDDLDLGISDLDEDDGMFTDGDDTEVIDDEDED